MMRFSIQCSLTLKVTFPTVSLGACVEPPRARAVGHAGSWPLAVRPHAPVISRPARAPCPAAPDQGARPLNPVSAAAALCQAVGRDGVCVRTQGRPRRPETAVMRQLR